MKFSRKATPVVALALSIAIVFALASQIVRGGGTSQQQQVRSVGTSADAQTAVDSEMPGPDWGYVQNGVWQRQDADGNFSYLASGVDGTQWVISQFDQEIAQLELEEMSGPDVERQSYILYLKGLAISQRAELGKLTGNSAAELSTFTAQAGGAVAAAANPSAYPYPYQPPYQPYPPTPRPPTPRPPTPMPPTPMPPTPRPPTPSPTPPPLRCKPYAEIHGQDMGDGVYRLVPEAKVSCNRAAHVEAAVYVKTNRGENQGRDVNATGFAYVSRQQFGDKGRFGTKCHARAVAFGGGQTAIKTTNCK